MKLWNYIKQHLQKHPEQTVSESTASMSFEDMTVWAEEFSKKLCGFECCAILCSSEMAASMALLACFAAEVTAIPLSMSHSALQGQICL